MAGVFPPLPYTPQVPVTQPPLSATTGKGTSNSADPKSPNAVDKGKGYSGPATASNVLINPPLHPKAETTFREGFGYVSLQRGMIRRLAGREPESTKTERIENSYRFRFLYNPAEIAVQNSVFQGVLPADYKNSDDPFRARFPGQEGLSFSLMLDRTNDVYDQGMATRGTMVDLDALYRVINGTAINPGFLTLSAVEIHWGPRTQNSQPLPPYVGFITNLTINHVKFTPRMIPMRTVVNITVNRLVGYAENELASSTSNTMSTVSSSS